MEKTLYQQTGTLQDNIMFAEEILENADKTDLFITFMCKEIHNEDDAGRITLSQGDKGILLDFLKAKIVIWKQELIQAKSSYPK